MTARTGKKSGKITETSARGPSAYLPGGVSTDFSLTALRKTENHLRVTVTNKKAKLPAKHYTSHINEIRQGGSDNTVEYVINVNRGQSLTFSIPADLTAELDNRILAVFADYASAATDQQLDSPALVAESVASIPKHEAILNMIFASSEWYDSVTLSSYAGFSGSNPSAQPNRWKKSGKLFALKRGKSDMYPSYAFGDDFRPLPAMKSILNVFHNKKSDFKIAAWFSSGNSWLRNKRPLDLIGTDPDAVIKAAEIEVSPIDHG